MVVLEVCVGSACHLKGAYNVINGFKELVESKKLQDKVEVKAAFCLGNCTKPVSVRVNGTEVCSVKEDKIEEFFKEKVENLL